MAAFTILVEKYKKPLFGYIYTMMNNQELAEDIFQETFIRVIKNIHTYKDNGNFKSWIFRISNNLCKDHWKRKSTHDASFDDFEKIDFNAKDFNFIDAIVSEEDINWLRHEIEHLPEKLKEVLLLHVYSEFTFKQIALELDCSINTVLGRMHYAKIHLKEKWEKHDHE